MIHKIYFFIFFIFIQFSNINLLSAKNLLNAFSDSDATNTSDLIKEIVLKKSRSNKIIIISNNSNAISPGNYISLIVNNKLVARSLVIKVKKNLAAIKILSIYSLSLWKQFKLNTSFHILRGDDTKFLAQQKKPKQTENDDFSKSSITTENDLYSTLESDDTTSSETEKTKNIKTDNLIGASFSTISGLDNNEQC